MFALLSASGANAQTSGGSPNPFVNINALEGVSSYEVQADGTLKVVLADGRTLMLPADAFVSTEAGLFLDLPVLTEAMTASAAAAGIAGSPLLLPFLAVGGAGAAVAAAAGGSGGESDGGTTVSPSPSPPAPPPPPPPANQAPVFTSVGTATIGENATGVAYTAAATDADGNAITYALSGPDAAHFGINSSTGAVTFRSPPDFEMPADSGGNNVYDVVVSASDGTTSTSQTVAIAVTNVNDNAPTFSSGNTAIVAENTSAVAYTTTASDADGSVLTYSLSGADAALFNIDAVTGAVTFRSPPNFEAPADAGGDNRYDLIITASDGALTTSQSIAITVTNQNDNVPVITSGGSVSVLENTTGAIYTATASDADGSVLTYALSGVDAGLFSIDGAAGAVTFKTSPDFEAPADAGGNNTYDIVVSSFDGVATTSRAVVIAVANANDIPPVISAADVMGASLDTTPAATGSITFADGDFGGAHVVSVVAAGAGYVGAFHATIASPAGADGVGRIDWSYAANSADLVHLAAGETRAQSYVVTLSDGVASVTQSVLITITGANQSPTIAGAAQSVGVDQEHASASGAIAFSDHDLTDSHTVSLTPTAPDYLGTFRASIGNAATNDGTGRVDWAFSIDSSALQYLTAGETLTQTYQITVADTHGGAATQSVTVFINGQNNTPTITSATTAGAIFEDGAVATGGAFAFADPDAGSVHTASFEALGAGYVGTFSASVTDEGGADGTGELLWSFTADNSLLQWLGAGEVLTQTYAVRLHDGATAVTRNVVVTITGANDAPVVSGSVVATNQELAISGKLAASDIDGDALLFSIQTTPQHGIALLQADGAYVYTPDAGYSGSDSFTFSVSDGLAATMGTVSIDVARGEFRVDYAFDHADVVSAGLPDTHDYPEVAALAGGGHVAVWVATADVPAGTAKLVYAQMYGPDGEKAGAAILVDPLGLMDQMMPSAAGLADGGFVVVWQGVSFEGLGVYAQRYTALGVATGDTVLVNATPYADPQDPTVTLLAGGGFAVSWTANDPEDGSLSVYARVFDATGVAVTGDLIANTSQFGYEFTQGSVTEGIAALAGGRFAVVFTGTDGADGDGLGVYARVFEADGTPLMTEQILVNTTVEGAQHLGSISALASGGFVVTWTDENGLDGSGSRVFVQRFDADGNKVGGEIRANTATDSSQIHSKVEQLGDGGFVVVWQSHGAGEYDIHGQRFDASGGKVGGEFTVPSLAGTVDDLPSIAAREDGTLVLVWRGHGGTIDQTIITSSAGLQNNAKVLVGGTGPDSLLGWDKADAIQGGDGDDRIAGLGGADTLTGGAGRDHFIYHAPSEGGDTITDFTPGQDKIEVSAAGFGGGLSVGAAIALVSQVNPIATGNSGAFLYDTGTGDLSWDRDGGGAAPSALIARLAGAPSITAGDIVVSDVGASGSAFSDLGVITAGMYAAPIIETLEVDDHFAHAQPVAMELLTHVMEEPEPPSSDADLVQPAPQDEHGWQ
ncbi:MAG TPA: VCBS domain-containing protein [Hyphomonadaceae bacterium]|nr:VCBS domain-containing protein [Hyphomonadaceae bacterium]